MWGFGCFAGSSAGEEGVGAGGWGGGGGGGGGATALSSALGKYFKILFKGFSIFMELITLFNSFLQKML